MGLETRAEELILAVEVKPSAACAMVMRAGEWSPSLVVRSAR